MIKGAQVEGLKANPLELEELLEELELDEELLLDEELELDELELEELLEVLRELPLLPQAVRLRVAMAQAAIRVCVRNCDRISMSAVLDMISVGIWASYCEQAVLITSISFCTAFGEGFWQAFEPGRGKLCCHARCPSCHPSIV